MTQRFTSAWARGAAIVLLALVLLIGAGCDDFPSVAIQNDLDRPIGLTWSHEIDERLIPVNSETSILVGEGESLKFEVRYNREIVEIEVPWSFYSLTADQIGDSDYRIFLSSVMPDR